MRRRLPTLPRSPPLASPTSSASAIRAAAQGCTLSGSRVPSTSEAKCCEPDSPPDPVPPGIMNSKAPQGTPIRAIGTCCWDLGPDEALYIESGAARIRPRWSFQLVNAWWEAPDQQKRQARHVVEQAYLAISDGRFSCRRFAHRGPDVPGTGWIPAKRVAASSGCRCVPPRNKQPLPTVRLVKIERFEQLFPRAASAP